MLYLLSHSPLTRSVLLLLLLLLDWSLSGCVATSMVNGGYTSLCMQTLFQSPNGCSPVNSPADLQPLELFVWLKTASCLWPEAQDPRERRGFYAFWTFLTRPTVLMCQSVPPISAKAGQALFRWVSVCACAQILISFRSLRFKCVCVRLWSALLTVISLNQKKKKDLRCLITTSV